MNTDPFAQFKPFKKHPTSEWPLFNHWLDDTFDISTAPQQYLFWISWLSASYISWRHHRSMNRMENLPALDIASSTVRANFLGRSYSRRWGIFLVPLISTFGMIVSGSFRRSEEQDRDGRRFNEYFRRARACEIDDETAIILAKDIVMRSDTFIEGRELLERSLSRLIQQGFVPEPQFNREGLYILPDHLRAHIEGPVIIPTGIEAAEYKQQLPVATEQNSV